MRKLVLSEAQSISYIPYKQYMASPYFQRLRYMVGVGVEDCERCGKEVARLPHHLTYKTLTKETKRDVVGVCHACNKLAQFYDDGTPVPLDELSLRDRWKEINSIGYKLRRLKPSEAITNVWNWFSSVYSI